MYRIIRFGTGLDPVIMISLADVGPNTQEANRYFSGVADGMGFEKPPEKNFPNLDAILNSLERVEASGRGGGWRGLVKG